MTEFARSHMLARCMAVLLAAAFASGLGACAGMPQIVQSGGQGAGQASENTLTAAIRQSLELSSVRAADLLSQPGGYQNSSVYRIQLPQAVQPLASRLRQFGLGGQIDQIEKLMNEGAEHAAVEARALFVSAVRAMTISDALGIIGGGDTAATRYFRDHTEAQLRQRYQPVIHSSLQQIGFYTQYERLLSAYKQLPLSNKPDLDLEAHVLNRSLDALFTQIGEEEKAIRKDPIRRGSSAIAAVFGR